LVVLKKIKNSCKKHKTKVDSLFAKWTFLLDKKMSKTQNLKISSNKLWNLLLEYGYKNLVDIQKGL